jgi:hypothetical protein
MSADPMTANEQALALARRILRAVDMTLGEGPVYVPLTDMSALASAYITLVAAPATGKESLQVADHPEDTRAMVEGQATCGTCRHFDVLEKTGFCVRLSIWRKLDWHCADHQPAEAK